MLFKFLGPRSPGLCWCVPLFHHLLLVGQTSWAVSSSAPSCSLQLRDEETRALWPTQALQPLQLHLDFYQTGKWASSWKVDAFTRHNIVHGQEVKSQSHICTCCSFLCWDKRKERRNWIPACYVFPKVSSSCFKQIGIVTFFKSQVFSQECEKPGFCISLPVRKLYYYQLPQQRVKFL